MKKIILIGLGNPNDQYKGTRHNVGKDFLIWKAKFENHFITEKKLFSYFFFEDNNVEIHCIMPTLHMNSSGLIFNDIYLKNLVKESENKVIIIHDDLEVPFSKFKFRKNEARGERGHNGNRSIISHLQSLQIKNFTKPYFLSIGIGRPNQESVDVWVLKKFNFQEIVLLEDSFYLINILLKTEIYTI